MLLPGSSRPAGPPPLRRAASGFSPIRLFLLSIMAVVIFLVGYQRGRYSCAAASAAEQPRELLAAQPTLEPTPCPPVEPCVCDCLGLPDRKLIDAGPKKPFALPFTVGKEYKHVSAEAEGDEQHKGGGKKAAAAAAAEPPPPAPVAAAAAAPEAAQQPALFEPPPKPMADSASPPAFLAAMFKKEHGAAAGGGGGGGGAAAAAPAAPAAAAASAGSSAPLPPTASVATCPAASSLQDQCGLPAEYRGAMDALAWLGRPQVQASFVLALGKHAAENKVASATVHSTLYPGSRSALGGVDIWALVSRNDWEANSARVLRETLAARPGADVIDIGAWVGATALHAALLGAGKVLAVEPDPLAFEELWANVRLNPATVGGRTVALRHCASDRAEVVAMKTVPGSTAYLLRGWDAASAAPGEVESTWSVHCAPIPALAAAHGMTPGSVGLLKVSAAPGMELYIGKTVLDWAMSTPAGQPKPGLWLTLHTHKWGDKTLGHHVLMPLVRAYKFAYDTWLNPLDLELAERKGEGPCPKEHGLCSVWLTDIPMSS